jgi:rhamnose utilization protein RhaD (predicted bifunctional aldolase and dehydrogenase)
LPTDFSWTLVPYNKPGGELAQALHEINCDLGALDFILLQNHGIIVVDDELSSLSEKLKRFLDVVEVPAKLYDTSDPCLKLELHASVKSGFDWVLEPQINMLATNSGYLRRVRENWVMYPDHAVFLGPYPCIVEQDDLTSGRIKNLVDYDFIFVSGQGVLQKKNTSAGAVAQLLCFADVVMRLEPNTKIKNLSHIEVESLLQWDAEKYRQRQAKL